jgi:hypothetical protein
MATATVASTAVEPAATAAVESITAVIAAADEAAGIASPVAVVRVSVIATMSVIPTAAVVATTTVEAMAIAAVEPGAGADEDASGEVVRAVVAVRSAGVRIVAVVTVSAGWRWADGTVHGTYPNPHANLSVGITRGKK